MIEKIYRSNGGASTSLDFAETINSLGDEGILCIGSGSVIKMKIQHDLHLKQDYGTKVPLKNICPIPGSYPIRKRIADVSAHEWSFRSIKSAASSLSVLFEKNEKHFAELLSGADLIIDACMLPMDTFYKIKRHTSAPIIYNHNGSPDAVDSYWISDYHLTEPEMQSSNKYSIFCSRYNGILFQANDQAAECVRRGAMPENNVYVVPPSCLEKEVLAARLLDSPYKIDRRSLVHVGSIIPRKAQHLAIEAFHGISAQFPDVDLHFVGGRLNNDYAAGLFKLVKELNLEERVYFHGHRPDYLRFMAHAEILIQSSKQEGVSRILRETMLMKIPIVSFDISGTSSTLESGKEALLVEPENVQAMAEAITTLLTDKHLAESLAGAAFQKYLLKHSWPVYANNIKMMIGHFTGSGLESATV
ncbi:MAG: glycosyltransferase family 4 protein [Cyclonatronaceae bacterium]